MATASSDASGDAESSKAVPAYAGARAGRNPDPTSPAYRFAQVPYMQRYKPTADLWEVGFYVGMLFPSDEHGWFADGTVRENFSDVSPNFGTRVGYYPLSFLGVEGDLMVSPTATGITDKSALIYAARAQIIAQYPEYTIVPFVTVGGGIMGQINQTMGHNGDPMFDFGVGAKAGLTERLMARLDLRDNLTESGLPGGSIAHAFEATLGITFTFERTPPESSVVDSDYDGLYDHEDKCPEVGALTADGCEPDTDGDGVLDSQDDCPKTAGQGGQGCPNPDVDGDKIPNTCDACPEEVGVAPDGCAVKDKDGDGINDKADRCVDKPETKNGYEDQDGCPDAVPDAVKKFTGAIKGIVFEKGNATIKKESYPTLDSAVKTLSDYPSISIEVSGHTSSEGTAEINQKLSEERANAVRAYLVEKGITESRIVARGAGASEPIADEKKPGGAEKNRRIEFKVLAAQ